MAISRAARRGTVQDAAVDDTDITAALASGDHRQALTLLMTRYGDAIFRYALGMTGDHALADEIRQQVFVAAFRDLGSFAGRAAIRTWLFGIARYRCLDAAKARKRWNRRYKNAEPDVLASDGDPDRDIDRHRLVQIVRACLQKLAPAVLEAIMLRYQQDLPYSEVAALIGDKTGTVQQRVARALPVLRRCVDAQLCPGGAK